MSPRFTLVAAASLVVGVAAGSLLGPVAGRAETSPSSSPVTAMIGDTTHPYVLSSPIFTPKTGTSFTTLFTSTADQSMSMLLRRYDAVGTLLTSQAITIGAHGSLQASPAAHSGAPLHVEIWAPQPHITMLITYTDSGDVARRIEPGDMIKPIPPGAALNVVTPFRVCDTQATSSPNCTVGKLASGGSRTVQIAGVGGLPAAGVRAVVISLTALASTRNGSLTAFADGATRPPGASLRYLAGKPATGEVTVMVGGTGRIRIFNASAGSTHVKVDVIGFYT